MATNPLGKDEHCKVNVLLYTRVHKHMYMHAHTQTL